MFQPGLRAAWVVSGNPGHPDIPTQVDVFVVVDAPAVGGPALGSGAVHKLRIFP